jgi:GNAT superfamily N-acetyltransferase
MSYRVRLAGTADLPLLAPLERAAAARFAGIGLAAIAQGRPTDEAEYRAAIAGGRLWVVEQEGGPVAGLAIADRLDGDGYLAEICVHPDHAGRRLAARMIAAVEAWAAGLGCRRLTLTTFRDVPWNRPYYERLGFAALDEAAAGPQLRAVRAKEKARGVDLHGARLCMVREIGRTG